MDSPHCKTFVENIQTAFNTKMPPKSMLLHGEVGRSGGDLSAGKKIFGKREQGVGRGWSLVSLLSGENSLLLDGVAQTRV